MLTKTQGPLQRTIAQMSFLGTLALSVIFLKEKLSALKIIGMLCGISHGFCALDAAKFASRVASYSISAMDSLSGIPTYEQIIAKDDWK